MTILNARISLSSVKSSTPASIEVEASSSRRALVAAAVGNTAEWYDFAIYGALATVITPLFFPDHSSTSTLFAAFAIFGTAFISRPFGSLYFGRRADAVGRRAVMVTVIVTMSVATAAIGLLPTYAAIGVIAPLLLVLLRVTQGFAAGGELGVSSAFLVEHSAGRPRGTVAAWQTATLAAGVAFGFTVAAAIALAAPGEDLGGWWRVAFLVAVPLAGIGVYIRRRTVETPGYVQVQLADAALTDSVREVWRHHRRALTTGLALVSAGTIAFNVFFIFVPNRMITVGDVALEDALLPAVAGLATTAVAALLLGRLSDRVGRRPVVVVCTAALVIAAVPAYVLAEQGPTTGIVVADSVVGICIGGALSVAMVAEMFPTPIRAAGIAMTAGLATALFGGTAPLVSQALVVSTGLAAAPGIYIAAAAVAASLAIRSWPETAFDELA